MSWNPVLNLFLEIKNDYIKACGDTDLWNYDSSTNCLEYWNSFLNVPKYNFILNHATVIEYDNLLLMKYGRFDQIFKDTEYVDFWNSYNAFFKGCRSVVIDIKKEILVLAPFDKFFNLNERPETSIEIVKQKIANAKNVEFADKLDGSMVSARWCRDRGGLVVATSSALNPETSWRLEYCYDFIKNNDNYLYALQVYSDITFIFEMLHPQDIHCVQYDMNKMQGLHLIGMRDVNSGFTFNYNFVQSIAADFDLQTTDVFDTTLDEVLSSLGNKKSNEAEGFVLDVDGWKVKIKYDDFVKMHGVIKTLAAPNLILEAFQNDNFDDVLAKIPIAYQPRALRIAANISEYIIRKREIVEAFGKAAKQYDNRKQAMIYINDNVPQKYQGKVRSFYLDQDINYLKNIKYYQILSYLGKED